jgi:large subunit ribosomal protein L23
MALFSTKKKTAKAAAPSEARTQEKTAMPLGLTHVLRRARITEKATMQQAGQVYAFDVAQRATKRDIVSAVRALYKVTPRKVRIVTIPHKTVRSMRTGRSGVKGGGKKAYVFLKTGETITF